MTSLFWVFIGGGLGSLVRYSFWHLLKEVDTDYPVATWAANIISCFILGALWAWTAKNSTSESFRLLLLTGFCGGFSTFSTFTLESILLLQNGNLAAAMINIILSVVVCMLSLWLGVRLFS